MSVVLVICTGKRVYCLSFKNSSVGAGNLLPMYVVVLIVPVFTRLLFVDIGINPGDAAGQLASSPSAHDVDQLCAHEPSLSNVLPVFP